MYFSCKISANSPGLDTVGPCCTGNIADGLLDDLGTVIW